MSTAQNLDSLISAEEYLDGELLSDIKHEYIAGTVYAMTGASVKHNTICSNIVGSLYPELKKMKSSCSVFSSDIFPNKLLLQTISHLRPGYTQ